MLEEVRFLDPHFCQHLFEYTGHIKGENIILNKNQQKPLKGIIIVNPCGIVALFCLFCF